jgi:glycine hydroxymethyltransferase
MHVIAAKAVCFREAAKPSFKEYQEAVIANADVLAKELACRGYYLVSGGTDNHLMLLDLRPSHPELTGKQAQQALDKANVTLNRNTVPGETRSPFQTSGLRIGSPAVTSRGMGTTEMKEIGKIIDLVLGDFENEIVLAEAREKALALCRSFELPY